MISSMKITGRNRFHTFMKPPWESGGGGGGGGVGPAPKTWSIAEIKTITAPLIKKVKEELIKYRPDADLSLIDESFKLALNHHKDETFFDEKPTVFRNVHMAARLALWKMPEEVIAAALLYTVDRGTMISGLTSPALGRRVAALISNSKALAKLSCKVNDNPQQIKYLIRARGVYEKALGVHLLDAVRIYEEMEEAAADDPKFLAPDFKNKICTALNITAEFLKRMSFYEHGKELEDKAFIMLDPENFHRAEEHIQKHLKKGRFEALHELKSFAHSLQETIKTTPLIKTAEEGAIEEKIETVRFEARIKSVFRAFQKLKSGHTVNDVRAIRFITDTEEHCYDILNIICEHMRKNGWAEVAGSRVDCISTPKNNGYQSLHIKFGKDSGKPGDEPGEVIEIQIRTETMHAVAEYGKASHLFYEDKSGVVPRVDLSATLPRERFGNFRNFLEKTGFKYVFLETGELLEFRPRDPNKKPNGFDLGVKVDPDRARSLKGFYSFSMKRVLGIKDALKNGDIVTPVFDAHGKDLLMTPNGRFKHKVDELAQTSLAYLFIAENYPQILGMMPEDDDHTSSLQEIGKMLLNEAMDSFGHAIKRQLFELFHGEKQKSIVSSIMYSLFDLASDRGLTETELYKEVALNNEQHGSLLEELVATLKRQYIATAYDPSEFAGTGNDKNLDAHLWLVTPNRPGILPVVTALMGEYGINLKNMEIEATENGDAIRYACILNIPDKKVFDRFRSRFETIYRDIPQAYKLAGKTSALIQLQTFGDRTGLAADITETITSSGAHILNGNIGQLAMISFEVLIPEVEDLDKILPLIRARLQMIPNVINIMTFESSDKPS